MCVLLLLPNMGRKWSSSTDDDGGKSEKYFIVKGRAYPELVQGANRTTEVNVDHRDRQAFYHHAAVQLSTADMDEINGAQGAPLCYEHRANDVVGVVHRSYMEDDKSLTIWGKIPLNARGKKLAAEIKAGKITGFSVGYGIDLACARNKHVTGKTFKEISLVSEPFFDNCKLTLNVTMSKNPAGGDATESDEKGLCFKKQSIQIRNPNMFYPNYELTDLHLFVPIVMSAEAPAAASTPTPAPAQQQQATLSTPAAGAASVADPEKEAQSLLKQGSILQDDLLRVNKEKEDAMAELKELRRFKAERDEQYRKDNEPRAQEFIATMEEAKGAKLTDAERAKYTALFTRFEFKKDADDQWAMQQFGAKNKQEMVALTASKNAAMEELKNAQAEKQKLTETLSKGASNMRSNYAANFATPSSEQKQQQQQADVAASRTGGARLGANEIMCPHPSVADMGFFKELGFQTQVGVNASASEDGVEPKQLRTSVQAARTHRLLIDPATGEEQFPNSARYHYPHIFGWMVNESGLATADLSNYTQYNQAREVREIKDAAKGVSSI
jgi:HK97 family phage prohead protease